MRLRLKHQLFDGDHSRTTLNFSYVPDRNVDNEEEQIKIGSKSTFEALGFGLLVKIFRFYGFRLNSEAERERNWLILGSAFFIILGILAKIVCKTFELIILLQSRQIELACFNAVYVTIRLEITIQYLFICFYFSTFRSQIQNFVSNFHRVIKSKAETAQPFNSKSRIFLTANVLFTLSCLTIVVCETNFAALTPLSCVSQILEVMWVIMIMSCSSSFIFLLIFLSKIVNESIDGYFSSDRDDDLTKTVGSHQLKHQNISDLLRNLSLIYSKFLMVSLIFQLALVVLFTRGVHAYDQIGFIHFALMSTVQLAFFVAKNVFSSSLNEKVKSLLTYNAKPTPIYNLKHCSTEHVYYILYLNLKQSTNQDELSYGGFFPVRKAFIFTVAGTAVTYAMLLREMK